jgi:hypothetical protein
MTHVNFFVQHPRDIVGKVCGGRIHARSVHRQSP